MIHLFNCPAAGTGAPCPRANDGTCAAASTKAPDGGTVICARPDESQDEALRRNGISAAGRLRLRRYQWTAP